jgi:hypothetical protein
MRATKDCRVERLSEKREMRMHSRPFAVIAIVVAAAACKDERCTVSTTQYTNTATAMATWETPPRPVARVDLSQDFVSHTPYAACAQGPLQDVGVVRGKITSLYPVPVKLYYDVEGLSRDGVLLWFHYDSLQSLKPNETIDLGDVTTTPTHIDVGARVIISRMIVLP